MKNLSLEPSGNPPVSQANAKENKRDTAGIYAGFSSVCQDPAAPKKLDQRVRMTRKLFRQALTDLLREKPLQSITVKELCATAGVNRGTFYTHYTDLYNLMEQMEEEVYRELQEALQLLAEGSPECPTPFSLYMAVMGFIRKNSDMCAFLLSEHGDRTFLSKLFDVGREACIAAYAERFPQISLEDLNLFYDFVSSGCLGVFRKWIAGGMVPSETVVAQSLERIIAGAQEFLR